MAHAEHGVIQAQALIDVEGRYGAGLLAEALWLEGPVRLGASLGTGALSNGRAGDADKSNVFGVLAPTLWLGQPTPGGVFGELRLGGFAGGRKGGFLGGFWLGSSVGYRIELGENAALRLAAELWLLYGSETSVIASPAIGLTF